jgi:hypothetical protein
MPEIDGLSFMSAPFKALKLLSCKRETPLSNIFPPFSAPANGPRTRAIS